MQKLPADSVDLIVADSPCDASDIQIDFSSNLIPSKSKSNQEMFMNKTLEDEIKRLYKECGVDPSAKPKIRNKINSKTINNKLNTNRKAIRRFCKKRK